MTMAQLISELVMDGLLVREGDGPRAGFRFLHLTFLEFLSARALADLSEKERVDFVKRHCRDSSWEEAIVLSSSLLSYQQQVQFTSKRSFPMMGWASLCKPR